MTSRQWFHWASFVECGVVAGLLSCGVPSATGDASIAEAGGSDTSSDADKDVVEDGDATYEGVVGNIFRDQLHLWLDADEASTIIADPDPMNQGRVAMWLDRSPDRRLASAVYLETSGFAKVERVPGVANGHAALRLPGDPHSTGAFSPGISSQMYSLSYGGNVVIAIVAAYTNNPLLQDGGQAMLYRRSSPSSTFRGGLWLVANTPIVDAGAESRVYAGTGTFKQAGYGTWTSASGWNDGKFHSFGMTNAVLAPDGGRPDVVGVRVDGQVTTSGLVLGGVASGEQTWIGGELVSPSQYPPFVDMPLQGYIAEVIVATMPTEEQITKLSAYFQAKYGVPF